LDRTVIRLFEKLPLKDPVFIDLSSEAGSATYAVGLTLLDNTGAEKIGEVYSPYLPDYAISEESGLCHLPRLDIYAATKVTPNLLILSGAENLDPDNVQAHYELAETILKNATEMGCKRFITCTAIRSKKAEEKIYIAATSSAETTQITERHGGKPFSLGRIMIPTGPLLGLAKTSGLRVLCIIGIIAEDQTEEETAQLLYDYLVGALELKTEHQ
jgi:proteasome assembly chaperone (PAC2) family protein